MKAEAVKVGKWGPGQSQEDQGSTVSYANQCEDSEEGEVTCFGW